MRLVSYNILDGGIGRADPLAEVILAQRPDIVALIEADDLSVVERIASRAKMDYIHATGGAKGAAILSRWNIIETIDHALLHPIGPRALVEARIADASGNVWPVLALHLNPGALEADEQSREKQLVTLLEVTQAHRDAKTPHVLLGDFNSNSPAQKMDPARLKSKSRQSWESNGQQIPRRVIQKLLDAGYTDTIADPSVGTFSTQEPGQRVDFIFTWGLERSRISSGWVEQDRLAKYASDHFPIGAEIRDR